LGREKCSFSGGEKSMPRQSQKWGKGCRPSSGRRKTRRKISGMGGNGEGEYSRINKGDEFVEKAETRPNSWDSTRRRKRTNMKKKGGGAWRDSRGRGSEGRPRKMNGYGRVREGGEQEMWQTEPASRKHDLPSGGTKKPYGGEGNFPFGKNGPGNKKRSEG